MQGSPLSMCPVDSLPRSLPFPITTNDERRTTHHQIDPTAVTATAVTTVTNDWSQNQRQSANSSTLVPFSFLCLLSFFFLVKSSSQQAFPVYPPLPLLAFNILLPSLLSPQLPLGRFNHGPHIILYYYLCAPSHVSVALALPNQTLVCEMVWLPHLLQTTSLATLTCNADGTSRQDDWTTGQPG